MEEGPRWLLLKPRHLAVDAVQSLLERDEANFLDLGRRPRPRR